MRLALQNQEPWPWTNIASGLVAATVQLTTAELAAALLPHGRSPTAAVIRAVTDLLPAPVVDAGVALLQMSAKPILNSSVVGALLGLGAIAGGVQQGSPGIARLVLAGSNLVSLLSATRQPDHHILPMGIASGAGGTAGVLVLQLLSRSSGGQQAVRRATFCLLYTVGAGLLARYLTQRTGWQYEAQRQRVRLPLVAGESSSVVEPGTVKSGNAGSLPPPAARTPHYPIDVNASTPLVDTATWRLRVHGLVQRELAVSLDDLLSMPLVDVDATLVCIHNTVGGTRMGTAGWRGVPLMHILQQAGIRSGGSWILATAVDGFSMALPLPLLEETDVALIAVGMNGEPLPLSHGFPARLLIPATYGQEANLKWLAELKVTTADSAKDYWSRRGWPHTPTSVQPQARIDTPRDGTVVGVGPVTISGIAWAQSTGVGRVEVQIDDAAWREAGLGPEQSPVASRTWHHIWQATSGIHVLRARVVDHQGTTQVAQSRPYFPRGATGYHTVYVHVVEIPRHVWATRVEAQFASLWRAVIHRLWLVAQNSAVWWGWRKGPK